MFIKWSDRAKAELADIALYYKLERSEIASLKVVSQIKAATNSLKRFPKMAPVEELITDEEIEYRSLLATKIYKVIYRIEGRNIYIVSIFDCRQNPEKLKQIK